MSRRLRFRSLALSALKHRPNTIRCNTSNRRRVVEGVGGDVNPLSLVYTVHCTPVNHMSRLVSPECSQGRGGAREFVLLYVHPYPLRPLKQRLHRVQESKPPLLSLSPGQSKRHGYGFFWDTWGGRLARKTLEQCSPSVCLCAFGICFCSDRLCLPPMRTKFEIGIEIKVTRICHMSYVRGGTYFSSMAACRTFASAEAWSLNK